MKRSLLGCTLAVCAVLYAFSQDNKMNLAYLKSIETDTVNAIYPDKPSLSTGNIRFATAFRWNRSGPTGGYWNDNDVSDDVFRPVFTNVSKYNLKVYNRQGFKVFESSDPYRGWDGYLENGDLSVQGVYIWKATGTFTDGSTYSKIGDVTFIY